MLATDTPGINGQIYNVADDEPVTAAEIMQLYGEPIAKDAASRKLDSAFLNCLASNSLGVNASSRISIF